MPSVRLCVEKFGELRVDKAVVPSKQRSARVRIRRTRLQGTGERQHNVQVLVNFAEKY
jgi:hypothetical protein